TRKRHGLAVAKPEHARERRCSTSVRGHKSQDMVRSCCCRRACDAVDREWWTGECVAEREAWVDAPRAGSLEKYAAALNNPHVSYHTEVVERCGVPEQDSVLAANQQAGDVERSKVDRSILVGLVVTSSDEMV